MHTYTLIPSQVPSGLFLSTRTACWAKEQVSATMPRTTMPLGLRRWDCSCLLLPTGKLLWLIQVADRPNWLLNPYSTEPSKAIFNTKTPSWKAAQHIFGTNRLSTKATFVLPGLSFGMCRSHQHPAVRLEGRHNLLRIQTAMLSMV